MGKIPHGCATTTPITRRFIQQSAESIQTVATRLASKVQTARKWRKRANTEESVTRREERCEREVETQ